MFSCSPDSRRARPVSSPAGSDATGDANSRWSSLRGLARASALAVVLAGSLGASEAHAQATSSPPSEAMVLFDTARAAYREGRYADAAVDLERALVLDPNAPALLYNLGRVYELMGRFGDAVTVFERLLALTPASETEERARTEQILERVRGAAAHATPPPTESDVGSMDDGPTWVRERGVADDAFWATFLASGVLGLGAGALGVVAMLEWQQAGTTFVDEGRGSTLELARQLGIAADITGGVAGATAVASLLLFALRERVVEVWPDQPATASLTLVPGPTPFSLGVAGAF